MDAASPLLSSVSGGGTVALNAAAAVCPLCGLAQSGDQTGVVRCTRCDYCRHPSRTEGVCDLCGHDGATNAPLAQWRLDS